MKSKEHDIRKTANSITDIFKSLLTIRIILLCKLLQNMVHLYHIVSVKLTVTMENGTLEGEMCHAEQKTE